MDYVCVSVRSLVILNTALAVMFIYYRQEAITTHLNLTLEADDNTDRFINSLKPRGKHMYHLLNIDDALHVAHAVGVSPS